MIRLHVRPRAYAHKVQVSLLALQGAVTKVPNPRDLFQALHHQFLCQADAGLQMPALQLDARGGEQAKQLGELTTFWKCALSSRLDEGISALQLCKSIASEASLQPDACAKDQPRQLGEVGTGQD